MTPRITITPEEVRAVYPHHSHYDRIALAISDPAIQQLVVRRRVEALSNKDGNVRVPGGAMFVDYLPAADLFAALCPEVPDHG